MRITFMLLTALLITTVTPAFACSCLPDHMNTEAKKVLSDPVYSVVDVLVRGANPTIGQSMLEIKNVVHGALVASDIRAKFETHSCGVFPTTGQKRRLVIKAENDGRYSIVGDCAHTAVIQHLKGQ